MDFAGIAAAMTALTEAGKLVKGFKDLANEADRNAAVLKLQQTIMEAQTSAMSGQVEQQQLINKVRDLEKRLAELEGWEAEKSRYVLTDFGGGTFAYLLKPDAANGEPDHRLCANCFDRGEKSVLQFHGISVRSQEMYQCKRCDETFYFGVRRERR